MVATMTEAAPDAQDEAATSESVRTAERQLGKRPVSAAAFAVEILRLHPEYADRRGEQLLEPLAAVGRRRGRGQDARKPEGWLNTIGALIDQSASPRLNGRLVLLGLALLDDQIFQILHGWRALEPLVSEIVIASGRRPEAEMQKEWATAREA